MTGPEVATWSETLGLLSEGPLWHEECQELQWVDILGSQLHRGRLAADGGPDRVRTIADRSVRRGGRTPSWEAETCSLRAWGFCR